MALANDKATPLLNMYFATVLKEIREKKGISQDELAMRADLDRTYISLLERGLRHPSLKVVISIAVACEMKASEFVQQVEKIVPSKIFILPKQKK